MIKQIIPIAINQSGPFKTAPTIRTIPNIKVKKIMIIIENNLRYLSNV